MDPLSRSMLNLANKVAAFHPCCLLTNQKIWRHEKGQPFKIPNKLLYSFDSGAKYGFSPGMIFDFHRGAFSCSFSHNGLYLAIACMTLQSYPIKVFDVLTGERVATLEGHQDLVYQLNWSMNDE